MKLVIHHHTEAYVDANGIWVQSFIGSWVSEIAKQIENIGLLLHTTNIKTKKLDYCINDKNVLVESLGVNKGLKNRTKRLLYIQSKCKNLKGYSHLLVRGVTPRQFLIINSSPIKNKFFLFVGSINDAADLEINSLKSLLNFVIRKFRNYELRKISRQSSFATNSPITVKELNIKLNIPAIFIPTNTISIKEFKRVKRIKKESFRMLFVGRVTRDKGIEELINAYQIVQKKYSKMNFFLDVVGPYCLDYLNKIRKKYPQNFDNISFHGFIQYGDTLFDFYDNSNVYVLPSYHEGFPHTIWEAAARQLPIICTKVGGIPGLIDKNMVTFVDKKSVKSLVQAIEEVCFTSKQADTKSMNIWKVAKDNCVENSVTKLVHWMSI